jgi:prepilin-type N-terminal cleavage/methylation domain-containing protein
MTTRAFTLIEVMVAAALLAVVATVGLATFQAATSQQGKNRHEWVAFAIGQQRMELLSAAPKSASILTPKAADDLSTNSCVGVETTRNYKVDQFGRPDANGIYQLCWKVVGDVPIGNTRTVEVLVFYPPGGGNNRVQMRTVR